MIHLAIITALFLASIAGWMNVGGQATIASMQDRLARTRDDDLDTRISQLRMRRALAFSIVTMVAAIIMLTRG